MSEEKETQDRVRRWTASRKKDAVIRLLRGEDAEALSRELGVLMGTLAEWKETVSGGIELLLKSHKDHSLQEELDRVKKKIGELSMEKELLWKMARKNNPFPMGSIMHPKN